LTGSANIEVLPTFTLISTGVISGSGSLTKTNTGTLLLQPGSANLYLGGTTIAGGVLQIFADSALGAASSSLTIQTATLQALGSFSSIRPVTISGAAIIDTGAFQLSLSGVMSGSGASVEKKGTGTLILTGTNTYAGTFIITAGTLQGSSLSILGNVQDNGTLIFDQPSDGIYAGTLSQSGTFIKQGPGKVTFSADSSGFQGPVFINGGTLDVTGKLGGSDTITINSGGTLSGTGSVANVIAMSGGALSPGDPTGILTINGTLNLMSGSSFDANITPTMGGQASVASTTTISSGSNVTVIPATNTGGFYGVSATYIILKGPTINGTFGSVTSTNPNFIPSLAYQTISGIPSVLLKVIVRL
jgi:autotransporter-associated beta strand protein